MPGLYHICYLSVAKLSALQPTPEEGFEDIKDKARKANSAAGLTGCLIFTGQHFLQVIEGMQEDVEDTFGRISRDTRHTDLRVLSEGPIEARDFPEMAVNCGGDETLTAEALAEISAVLDYPQHQLHIREIRTLLSVVTQQSRKQDALLAG
ncbi:BLUF domain-containing protein [Pannonibacter phragmitetus]|uniref:BLUF domain-containing protein n=1 Tax=Pannonibacter phragmitetus TaxID=121719 RepID=UPI003D2F20A4